MTKHPLSQADIDHILNNVTYYRLDHEESTGEDMYVITDGDLARAQLVVNKNPATGEITGGVVTDIATKVSYVYELTASAKNASRAITDLEVSEDFVEKATAICNGIPYDTRIMMTFDLPEEDIVLLNTLVAERGISIDEVVEHALREAMNLRKGETTQ